MPSCRFAASAHPREGDDPSVGLRIKDSSQSPSARLSHKWLLQPGRRSARCKLAGSRAAPRLCSLQDADPHPGRTQALSFLSKRDCAHRSPRSRGLLDPLSPSACRAPSCAFYLRTARILQTLGWGPRPS